MDLLTVSSQFKAAHGSSVRYFKTKVEVRRNNPNAPFIDISDRVEEVSITHDLERRGGTAQLTLDNYDYTLSPFARNSSINLVGGVYDPLLDSNHTVKISWGIRLSDGTYEYVTRFTGVLGDEIDADSYPGQITLTARDFSKLLQDTYIFQSKTYKLQVVEAIIQDMITQFLPNSGIAVVVQNNTNFMIGRPDKPYTAKDINLWDAVQSLADTASHELMFVEDGTLVLRKSVKNWADETPHLELDETSMTRDRISVSDSDVRNHVVLKVQGLQPIEKKNEFSIQKYGRRYMEIHREMANVVATQEQAHRLVDDILLDLSYPHMVDNVEIPLHPLIQVGDYVTIFNTRLGTDPNYDVFKVIRVQDNFGARRKRTTLSLSGCTTYTPMNSIPPKSPTNVSGSVLNRTIQNYPRSGWSGNSKSQPYGLVTWSVPTQDMSGNVISSNFGGYTIYRKQMVANGAQPFSYSGTGNAKLLAQWHPVASVKSHIDALNRPVDYFYDYTAEISPTGSSYAYSIVAINQMGAISQSSNAFVLNYPPVTYN